VEYLFFLDRVLQALLVHRKFGKLDAHEREHLLSLQPSEHDDAETAYGKSKARPGRPSVEIRSQGGDGTAYASPGQER
jgi:hypothetical protein